VRTGIYEQGLSGSGNFMEVTETGVYFLCDFGSGRSYLLYGDHDSDSLVKLCARPDCLHNDRNCNAYFENGSNVYSDGNSLYVGEHMGTTIKAYRLDLDGGNRTLVMDSSAVKEGYRNGGNIRIRNGVFFFSLGKVTNGDTDYSEFYWTLDGSMEQPELVPEGYNSSYDDGRSIIMVGPGKNDGRSESGRYLWDSSENSVQWIADQPENYYGYVSTLGIYYMDDGVLYRKNAESESIDTLFDTGLKGDYEIEAFTDYFIIRDTVLWWKEGREEASLSSQTLRFYNWDYESLGECVIDYPVAGSSMYEKVIAGESESRIYLAARATGIPEYYIDKSDIGTGSIVIHPLELPEDIQVLLSGT
jgi:hypothetical protein